MDSDTMSSDVLHQAAVAMMLVHVMQFAKKVPWLGFLSDPVVAKIIAAVLVFVGAVGVKWQMTGTIHDGGTLVISWPMWSIVVDTAEHVFLQWAFQEGYYQKFVKLAQPAAPVKLMVPDHVSGVPDQPVRVPDVVVVQTPAPAAGPGPGPGQS